MFYHWFWWQYEAVEKAYTEKSVKANKDYWAEYTAFVWSNLYT